MTTSAPPRAVDRGASIGRYVVIDVLGRGGMGVVYSAYDTRLDRKLAIKFLRTEMFRGEGAAEIELRLLREAQAMARVTHPNVVAIHDVGTHEGQVFLAMEFVEGETLGQWLKTPRPFRERLGKVVDAGRGLAAAHRAGLIHRDFKPDNVLVAKDGRVVVLDFGLARSQADEGPAMTTGQPRPADPRSGSQWTTELTIAGAVLGTVGYMAPEQAFGEDVSAASDQFSFAALLYEALYGRRPFPARELTAYLNQTGEPIPEPEGGRDVPAYLRRVVERGLAHEQAARFPSMDAMLDAIAHDPKRRQRARLRALASVAVAIVAAGTALAAWKQRTRVCAPNPAEMQGVWDAEVRAAVRAALLRSPSPAAADLADRVTSHFDDYAAAWFDAKAGACRETKIEKRAPEESYVLESQCLERARAKVRSSARMLAEGDPRVTAKALDVAYALPNLAWCADVTSLRKSAGLPDDPALRARVVALEEQLDDIGTRITVGKLDGLEPRVDEAVESARKTGHAATIATALLNKGSFLQARGDFRAATPALREAALVAQEGAADAQLVQAGELLATTAGSKLQNAFEGHLWLDLAEATLKRMGGDEGLEIGLLDAKSILLSEVDWRPEESLPIDLRTVDAYRRVRGEHPLTANAIYNAGVSYSYLGDNVHALELFEQTAAMQRKIGGDSYSVLGQTLYMRGQTHCELGRFDDGERDVRRGIEILEANGEAYWVSIAYQALTWCALARGDARAAEAAADQALAFFEKADRPDVLVPIVGVPAGLALTRRDRAKEALALCERALATQEAARAIDPTKVYGWDALRCKAEALTALGRAGEAVPLLERSLTLPRRMFPGDLALVHFALARAIDGAHGDPARATDEAAAAQRGLAPLRFLAANDDVGEWLRAHRKP